MSKMFDLRDAHAWVEERLSGYIDGQLAPDERGQLEQHLRDCARCQASLASLRWTISLFKQAHSPAPALPRSFALSEPAKAAPTPRIAPRELRGALRETASRELRGTARGERGMGFVPGFAALRVATALATLLLCVAVSADFILQFGGAPAPAPALAPAARQGAAPTQAALAAPATQPSAGVPQVAPTSAPQPSAAFYALTPLAQPKAAATPTRALGALRESPLAPEMQLTPTRAVGGPAGPGAADGVTTSLATGTPTATATPTHAGADDLRSVPAATPTAPATTTAVARAEPLRIPPPSPPGPPRAAVPSLRIIEVGLLALVTALGALTFAAWRRK